MKYLIVLAYAVATCICGCDGNSSDRPIGNGEEESPIGTAINGGKEAVEISNVKIVPLLPQPIQTEEEAKSCMATAQKNHRMIEELSGAKNTSIIKRLKDCVVDNDESGYTKFYPDGVIVRFSLRSTDIADVNVGLDHTVRRARVIKGSLLHIRIDDTMMNITCRNRTGTHEAYFHLIRFSDAESFKREGDWDKIENAEKVENFCLEAYEDFLQMRNR